VTTPVPVSEVPVSEVPVREVPVSVVVPVFDGARFLAECLASLAAQDHPSLEIVVVDDGSRDDSAAIVEAFADGHPFVRLLRRAHEGLGASRNAGVDASRGELVGFCDADDTWRPDKASTQVAYLEAHPEVDIALCRQDTMIEPGVSTPDWLIPDQRYGDLDGVSPTSGLFRRAVFERVRYRTDMDPGTDFDLLVQARGAGFTISVIDAILRTRRIHDDNMTTRFGPSRSQLFASVRGHLQGRR